MNRLMRNKWVNVVIVGVFITALTYCGFAQNAHAEEVLVSVGAPALRGTTPAVDVSWRFDASTDAYWQASLTLIGESTHKDGYQPNNAALQILYVDGYKNLDLGIGVAFLQNTDAYNGSAANFALQLGYNIGPFYVQYRHWSNAGTVKPNLGRDLLFVGWRF